MSKVREMVRKGRCKEAVLGKDGLMQAAGGKKRMANLELLRCAAMMMVVVLHYLGKGGLLADLTKESLGTAEALAWLIESFCIVAVNVYMFISGYFLCMSSFKPGRLIQLWLQVWMYSVAAGLAGALTGVLAETPFDTHYLLTLLFPVSMGHYWFMTAYVYLYLLLPFVGPAVRKMTKQQMQIALGFLFFTFCILKSVLPVRLEMDEQGYDCLWYLCVFLAAAYVRRFGGALLKNKMRCLSLYVGCCLLIFTGTMALREIYQRTGGLERMMKMCLEYNHILPFLAAVGLFGFFSQLKIKGRIAEDINRIAPYTLGVYLLHENLGLRYSWQEWLGAGKVSAASAQGGSALSAALLLCLWTMAAAVFVFLCGVLADMVRKWVFDLFYRGLSAVPPCRRMFQWIEKADAAFQRQD